MVVNAALSKLKICDFGSACYSDENEITPYLVSRFYRAPEVMLGLQYDSGIDKGSVGWCLAELYTGKILFQGRTNNDMLKLFMEMKGMFPKKMLNKATFRSQHYDDEGKFLKSDPDPITKRNVVKVVPLVEVTRDLDKVLFPNSKLDEAQTKELLLLKDLLDKIFVYDPSKRLTVQQALAHPFLENNEKSSVSSPTTVSSGITMEVTSGVSVSLTTDVYVAPDYNMTEVYDTKITVAT